MRKLINIVILIGICLNSYSQEKVSYDIYILLKLKSDASAGQDFINNSIDEYYVMNWESQNIKQDLTLKIDENGKLIKGGIRVASRFPNLLYLRYKNVKNKNPPIKIPNTFTTHPMLKGLKEKELYKNRNVIRYDDFRYYNPTELLTIISNAKNLYVIFEEEKSKKYYFAKKVSILPVNAL